MNRQEFEELKNKGVDKIPYRKVWEMNRFIKETTLKNAEVILKRDYPTLSGKLIDYLMLMLNINFSSVETDDLLMHLKAYSGWMRIED